MAKKKSRKNLREEVYGTKIKNFQSKKRGIGLSKQPYLLTPSYVHHGGRALGVFRLYARSGTNRNMSFLDVIDIMPLQTEDGVSIFFLADDRVINFTDKKKVIEKRSRDNKMALSQLEKEENKKVKTGELDEGTVRTRLLEYQDYVEYDNLRDNASPIVVYRWRLVIVADTEEMVEQQLEALNSYLNKRHDGLQWDAVAGEQGEYFSGLYKNLPMDSENFTSTGDNYTGFHLGLSSGLMDEDGILIGRDALSLTGSSSYFDFNTYTNGIAFISSPSSSRIPFYVKEDEKKPVPASSIWGQAVANHITINGHRAFHIVLNDYDYFEKNRFYRPEETEKIFKRYPMERFTINAMQGFGEKSESGAIYSRLKQKIVDLFDIMSDLTQTPAERAVILKAVDKFYLTHKLWRPDGDVNWNLTRITDIGDPENYPTMTGLVSEFVTMMQGVLADGREIQADRIETISTNLEDSLTTYRSILGKPTSVKSVPKTVPQIFYEFKGIDSDTVKAIQFINSLEYIYNEAEEGDVVVIHGVNKLDPRVVNMAYSTINNGVTHGIRTVMTFDTITGRKLRNGKSADFFDLKGSYYDDLDADIDWIITGSMLPKEVEGFKDALNQELGQGVEENLQSKIMNKYLIHRRRGAINNFIYGSPFI